MWYFGWRNQYFNSSPNSESELVSTGIYEPQWQPTAHQTRSAPGKELRATRGLPPSGTNQTQWSGDVGDVFVVTVLVAGREENFPESLAQVCSHVPAVLDEAEATSKLILPTVDTKLLEESPAVIISAPGVRS